MRSTAINFIRRHRRPLTGTLVGVLIAGIAFTLPHAAFASGFNDAIMSVLANITYWLISFVANFLVVVINIMVGVAQYSKFLGVDAVEKGWAIVRDVCNMFFIVVLLIISFGTILRLENYRYNKLLARLIVMAFLVNFSKFIAGFFIDFSQVIMLTFVNAWRDIAAGNLTYALGLQDIVSLSQDQNMTGSISNVGPVLTALLLGLFLVTVAAIVMSIITIVLVLRILALWFLIVLSPLAFLLKTYPSTEKYAARWWQEFGKYVVTGPVVAFLLWLTLAIIASPTNVSKEVFTKVKTIESSTVLPGAIGGEDGVVENTPEAKISAAITTIGESEKLLSYLIGIMLLVGTLVITKELGVAGGQMAGQWADKIKGFATKAAVLGGAAVTGAGLAGTQWGGTAALYGAIAGKKSLQLAGRAAKVPAKGIGNAALDWAERRTKMVLRPKDWKEGFERGAKRRRDRSREVVYRGALDRWRGTTKDVAVRKWAFGKKKTLGFIPRPSREAVMDEAGQPVTEKKTSWHPILAMGAMPEFARTNLLTPGGLAAAVGGRFSRYRDAKEQYDSGDEELKRMQREYEEMSGLEHPESYAIDRHAKDHLLGEIQNRRISGDDSLNHRTTKDASGAEVREHIDDAMRAQGIDVHADPATIPDEEREQILQVGRNQYLASTTEVARVQEGQRLQREDAERIRNEAGTYTGPNARLTDEATKEQTKKLDDIKTQLARIDGDIKKKEAAGAPTTDLITKRDEMRKQAEAIGAYLREGKAEGSDKVLSEEYAKKLTHNADRLQKSADKGITEADLSLMRGKVDAKREQVRVQGEEVSKNRLPTPYELHNETRAAIAERKKQVSTDDWHEVMAIFEDAVRNKDGTLAAAALQRAAEVANENEIMNASGYDFSKGDFRAFITDIFEKKLKMSKDQALGIASDTSFIAEKNRHYNIMRSTTVNPVTGHREWQDEDEQTEEIVAEMNKMDAEDVSRKANRLAYGDEIVGYRAGLRPPKQDAPESEWQEYRAKKAKYFRGGGSREYMMSESGIGYVAGKFPSSFRGIEQGRFNDSFSIRATEPENMKILEKMESEILKGVKRKDYKDNDRSFRDYIDAVRGFAGAKERATINYVDQAINLMKKLRV